MRTVALLLLAAACLQSTAYAAPQWGNSVLDAFDSIGILTPSLLTTTLTMAKALQHYQLYPHQLYPRQLYPHQLYPHHASRALPRLQCSHLHWSLYPRPRMQPLLINLHPLLHNLQTLLATHNLETLLHNVAQSFYVESDT